MHSTIGGRQPYRLDDSRRAALADSLGEDNGGLANACSSTTAVLCGLTEARFAVPETVFTGSDASLIPRIIADMDLSKFIFKLLLTKYQLFHPTIESGWNSRI